MDLPLKRRKEYLEYLLQHNSLEILYYYDNFFDIIRDDQLNEIVREHPREAFNVLFLKIHSRIDQDTFDYCIEHHSEMFNENPFEYTDFLNRITSKHILKLIDTNITLVLARINDLQQCITHEAIERIIEEHARMFLFHCKKPEKFTSDEQFDRCVRAAPEFALRYHFNILTDEQVVYCVNTVHTNYHIEFKPWMLKDIFSRKTVTSQLEFDFERFVFDHLVDDDYLANFLNEHYENFVFRAWMIPRIKKLGAKLNLPPYILRSSQGEESCLISTKN